MAKISTKDFLEFLKEYKVVSLAIAFVMGAASTDLVKSLVTDVVMPVLTPLFSAVPFKELVWTLGPVHIAIGSFIAALINFLVIALVVFMVTKLLIKEDKK